MAETLNIPFYDMIILVQTVWSVAFRHQRENLPDINIARFQKLKVVSDMLSPSFINIISQSLSFG